MKKYLLYGALVVGVLAMGYVGWAFERQWNYHWSYKDQVHDDIREMVKPECLQTGVK